MKEARTDAIVQESERIDAAEAVAALAFAASLERIAPSPGLRDRLMRTVAERRRHAA